MLQNYQHSIKFFNDFNQNKIIKQENWVSEINRSAIYQQRNHHVLHMYLGNTLQTVVITMLSSLLSIATQIFLDIEVFHTSQFTI